MTDFFSIKKTSPGSFRVTLKHEFASLTMQLTWDQVQAMQKEIIIAKGSADE